jgi:hypothetical protein
MITRQQILNRLERITDGLSDVDNRWGIEEVIKDLNNLQDDINKGWDHKGI